MNMNNNQLPAAYAEFIKPLVAAKRKKIEGKMIYNNAKYLCHEQADSSIVKKHYPSRNICQQCITKEKYLSLFFFKL